MKTSLAVFFLLFYLSVWSQDYKPIVGRKLLNADSVIIIKNLEKESEKLIDSLLENNIITDTIFKNQKKLSTKKKKQLSSIFIEPSNFSGKFASHSGFKTGQILLVWKTGTFSFLKISLYTHDMYSSQNPTKKIIFIDPHFVDKLRDFYYELVTQNPK